MNGSKVSVLLTSYNQDYWLAQAIDSVLSQTYQNFELIILDDNSSNPNTPMVLSDHWNGCWNDSRVIVYKSNVSTEDRMKTCRYATMINIGFQLSSGQYITYLTDDDYYYPGRLQIMVDKLQEPGVEVVYGNQHLQYGDEKPHAFRTCDKILDWAGDIVDHNSVMHTRQAFERVGGWDDDPVWWKAADFLFWKRLTDAGYKFHPVNAVTEVHRFHTGSVRHKLLEQGLTDLN